MEDWSVGVWGEGPDLETGGVEEEGLVGYGFEDGLLMGFGNGVLVAE